jgi:hypothetical protein
MSGVKLLDGPAKGTYSLRRAPLYLRAVVTAKGKVDVLDMLDDRPRPGERVYVYRADDSPEFPSRFMLSDSIYVCVRTKDGAGAQAGGATGTYRHLPEVDGELVRETAAWRAWVAAQPEATR